MYILRFFNTYDTHATDDSVGLRLFLFKHFHW
jgi:hypothetical protein